MMENPTTGHLQPFDFGLLQKNIPELTRFNMKIDWHSFDEPIDSSNANPETWRMIASIIGKYYDDYDGFVVLHGTDTMAYTASALSFMLENLSKPVILTGSQLPLGRLRTDGKENLITAIEIAGMKQDGLPVLNEVAIFFEDYLFRGNRTFKYNTDDFDAFDSPNHPVLAQAGVHIQFKKEYLLAPPASPMVIRKNMDPNIAVLPVFPGISESLCNAVFHAEGIKAIILETYGSGNIPDSPWFPALLKHAQANGLIVVNLSQCKQGFVEQGRYATSAVLRDHSVWSAGDMTLEATLTKLMYLLGVDLTHIEREIAFHQSLRGERTTFSALV